MNRMFCRIYQFGLKIGNYFMGYRMPEYIEGAGCVVKLPKQIREQGFDNVFIVTGSRLVKSDMFNDFIKALDAEGIKYSVFSDLAPNPTSDNVEAGYKIYKENDCRAIIAFGGGGPMDTAKVIGARVARPNKSVAQLTGLLKVGKKIPVMWAIPTTSGTGSETTLAAVIVDSATHRKASVNDPALIPKYAVLDPELTIGLPPAVTATTGLDALCHAVESYTNGTYCTALENELALKAVRLIHDNLLTAYRDGQNIEARQNMQRAAFFAGRSFTRGCVGYVHAVGHTLGGLYGVPHGLAMGILLPHVMREFGSSAYKPLAELADACGIEGSSEAEKAEGFICWIEQLKKELDIPEKPDMIREEDIPQMVAWAVKEANPLYPVPQIWDEVQFTEFIRKIRA